MSEQPGREKLREANAAVERDRDELRRIVREAIRGTWTHGEATENLTDAILAAGWVSPAEARRVMSPEALRALYITWLISAAFAGMGGVQWIYERWHR